MKYSKIKIQNFKGIEEITLNLDKSPSSNIYTLVGLNESGKTTILEAINFFSSNTNGFNALELINPNSIDLNSLIPISKRDNFNDKIAFEVTLSVTADDIDKINKFLVENSDFEFIEPITEVYWKRYYHFKDSKYLKMEGFWSGLSAYLKSDTKKKVSIRGNSYPDLNSKLSTFCKQLIPSILYFPTFLFDFPARIQLNKSKSLTPKDKFYQDLIQDILFSLGNDTNIKDHLIDRILSTETSDRNNLNRLIQLMERKVSTIIFTAWNQIFRRQLEGMRVIISYQKSDENFPYLEFLVEAEDGIYQIYEKSLGFRWFFTFLLFTHFRPFRKDSPENIIFLFDEPASNLHSTAQKLILNSFENLVQKGKIIYTTHSHYMINPHWLESTYVVKNEGLQLENPEKSNVKKTNITIESYREFASKHPYNTAYFQPVLDVLDFVPSSLENIPDAILIEGKNDYYCLEYVKRSFADIYSELHFIPSTGSGNLDVLISLYFGWGRNFVVLLDSDKEGLLQKERYNSIFGLLLEGRIFTFSDVDSSFTNIGMEKVFSQTDLISVQKSCFPNSANYNKTQFNRSIQELLVKKQMFQFHEITLNNFKLIFEFLKSKI